jgi:prefoldin subunit 5
LVVAVILAAASQPAPAETDQVICRQLRSLAGVEDAIRQSLAENETTEQTILDLVESIRADIEACRKARGGAACESDLQARNAATVEQLLGQVESLRASHAAIAQGMKEAERQRRLIRDKLLPGDSCPEGR